MALPFFAGSLSTSVDLVQLCLLCDLGILLGLRLGLRHEGRILHQNVRKVARLLDADGCQRLSWLLSRFNYVRDNLVHVDRLNLLEALV